MPSTDTQNDLARTLAAEDVRRGDYVSILYEIIELPSFFWCSDTWALPPDQPVRLKWHTVDCGLPLKVKAVCLPFVFVKKPCGEHRTLDVRRHILVRLSPQYGRTVWKSLAKQSATRTAASLAALV